MHPDHTLTWLDASTDPNTEQVLLQIKEARNAHRYQEASRLCLNYIAQADQETQHMELGLVYCHLGENYRLQGVHYYREAADAFDQARVHFTLANKPPDQSASNQNKGVSYWSQAIVLEQMPGQWNTALRHYQSALDCIQYELDRTQTSSSLPRSRRAKLIKLLQDIRQLIMEDYDRLLEQQMLGDPKIVALTHKLEAAEKRMAQAEQKLEDLIAIIQPLVAPINQAVTKANTAAQIANQAANAASNAAAAADSASRKTTHIANQAQAAANKIQSVGLNIDTRAQQLLAAADRIEKAAAKLNS